MLSLHSVVVEKSGRELFAPITFTFKNVRCGLVGSTGVGKSSLALVLAGLEEPKSGSVERDVPVRYLPQDEPRPDCLADEFLADLWCTSAPGDPLWRRLLPDLAEGARVGSLSGGEWTRLRLLRLLASPGEFLILDEPTNHLDAEGRSAVEAFVEGYPGGMIVISHDRELLRHVDEIAELTPQGLQRFSGAFDEYWTERTRQRERQEAALDAAERLRRKAKHEAAESLVAQEKRMRSGFRRGVKAGLPKVLMGARKRRAEATLGRLCSAGGERVGDADKVVREAMDARQCDPFLRLDFEAAAPPTGAVHFCAKAFSFRFPGTSKSLWERPLDFVMAGRQRWRLVGANGSGKTTLLRLMLGDAAGTTEGSLARSARPLAYLDQDQGLLPRDATILQVLENSTRFGLVELRNELAFYGFTGERVRQSVGTMSGGERLRATLAAIFLGREIPQIVLLDEPTNNLDFQSQELLVRALAKFSGLLVVASHDRSFVDSLGLDRELVLTARYCR